MEDFVGRKEQRFFDSQVNRDVQEEIARAIIDGYGVAYRYCDNNFGVEEAHDLRPVMQRAEIEKRMRALQGLFHGAVFVSTLPNAGNNCYHVELRCGRTIITFSKTQSPIDPIREAVFRRNLAIGSYQLALFDPQPPAAILDRPLWAVVIHGVEGQNHERPDYINIVFPLVDGSHTRGINLLSRFPGLVEPAQFAAPVHIPAVQVTLKKYPKAQEETPS